MNLELKKAKEVFNQFVNQIGPAKEVYYNPKTIHEHIPFMDSVPVFIDKRLDDLGKSNLKRIILQRRDAIVFFHELAHYMRKEYFVTVYDGDSLINLNFRERKVIAFEEILAMATSMSLSTVFNFAKPLTAFKYYAWWYAHDVGRFQRIPKKKLKEEGEELLEKIFALNKKKRQK